MKHKSILIFWAILLGWAASACTTEPRLEPQAAPAGESTAEAAEVDPTTLAPTVEVEEIVEVAATAVTPVEATPTATAPISNLTDGCVQNYAEGIDYFPQKTAVTHADGFTIEYFDNYKVVTVAAPWLGAEDAATYLLVQCGTATPEGYDEAIPIEVPINSFVSMSTTYLPHLDMLGRLDSLVGLDFGSFAYNPNVRARLDQGEIVELGSGSTVNVEAALELAPDVIMTSASGSADFDTHPKLEEVGLTVMLNADYLDVTPLGRAEWAKFIAVLYNEEARVDDWFNGVVAEYEALLELTAGVSERPTVFANTPFEGTWYMPGGQSYTARLLEAAGASYLWASDASTSTLFLDFESVFDQAAAGEYWLNVGAAGSLAELTAADERFADFYAFQEGQIYNYDRRLNDFGGNDFFESAAANPQLVLADLIKIFHPELLTDHALVYYRLLP